MLFPEDITQLADQVIDLARRHALIITSAESCTGGLLAGALTEIAGSSDVFERGFVTYSNAAKIDCLGVSEDTLIRYGAVSEEVARAMAEGALTHSRAHLAVSITGIAGPNTMSAKPVGLVHFGSAFQGHETLHAAHEFGDLGRIQVRLQSVRQGLLMLLERLQKAVK